MFYLNKYMRMPCYCPEKQDVIIVKDSVSENDFVEKILRATNNRDDWDESFFVGNIGKILEKILLWKKLLPRIRPFYAVKSNCLQPVIATMAALGLGFDCASRIEINQVLQYGVNPADIVYAHPQKFISHLQFAKENGVDLMVFDDEEELIKVKKYYDKARLLLRIKLEHTDDVSYSDKFGASFETAQNLIKIAKEMSLDIQGICYHLGDIKNVEIYANAIASARGLFAFAKDQGITMNILDIGGGFHPIDSHLYQFTKAAEVISSALEEHFSNEFAHVQVIAEPGTYCINEAVSLLTNVIGKRKEKGVKAYFCGDGIYGSFNTTRCMCTGKFQPTAIFKECKKCETIKKEKVKLFGPSLDGYDVINPEAMVGDVNVGDWLLWKNSGDYTSHFPFGFNGIVTQKAFYFITESDLKKLMDNCENQLHLPLIHKDYGQD